MQHPLRTDVRGRSDIARAGRRWVWTTAITVLVALATSFSFASTTQAASAPADFAGLSNWGWPTDAEATQMGSDGVKTVRANLAWDWVEHTQGKRAWGGVDALMNNASANGYDLLMVLNGCVVWSCGATRTPPQTDLQREQFLSFVRDAVTRYGAGGTYWASRPNLQRVRVSWQVWNEVNVGADWPNPTAAGYTQLLQQTTWAIKAIDRDAIVVTSGLAELPAVASGQTLAQFLAGLEQDPAFRSAGDVVAIHGYADDAVGTARILDTARGIMQSAGDMRPLWITEVGWASGGPAHRFVRDLPGQAAELRNAFDLLVGCRARWNLQRTYWFSVEDVAPEALGEADYWGMHTGLYDVYGQPKPSAEAFREYLGGKELPGGRASGCPLSGGNDVNATVQSVRPPVVTIRKAPQYVGKEGRQQVDFNTDMGNAGNAQCSLNGGAWVLCATPFVIPKTFGEGTFTLQIRAISPNGVVGAPVAVSWTVDLTPPTTIFEKRPPKRVRSKAVSVRLGVRAPGDTASTDSKSRGKKSSKKSSKKKSSKKSKKSHAARATTPPEPVTYQCKLNHEKWKPCKRSQRVKTKRTGRQLLKIRAVDLAGNVDPRGAQARYTVLKASRH